jgi:thiamine phosphate synthase YjbQ (UPF0047 family)
LQPTEITLTLAPAGRFDVIDVTRCAPPEWNELQRRHRRALYASFHTTAGYLDHRLAARLLHHREHLSRFLRAFGLVFPPGAAYRHDQMHLREELSEAQRRVEPRNGDSHLTFMGSGMRNLVTCHNRFGAPVYFIDLDGLERVRQTRLLAYDDEDRVARTQLSVPVSRHPIDAVNLADPRLGVIEAIEEQLEMTGVQKGRVEIALAHGELGAGITVNEYETLLMRHDLAEVLSDPLRFAKLKGRHIFDDPLALPSKSINYAKYDMVHLLNSLMEAFRVDESVVERLVAKAMAVPARLFLRSRRVSFLASDHDGARRARLVRGQYQSPILVQWQAAPGQSRRIDVSLYRLD